MDRHRKPAQSHHPRTGLLLVFMWGAYFLNYCDRQAVFAMFPALKMDLGFTDTQLGLTGAIFIWVYGICSPISGQIADRYSKRTMVVLSLGIWSVVTIATGFAGSVFILLALRALMGISESLYMPAAIALTANAHAPERRSRAISILTTAQILGTVAGGWFAGVMAERGQWREAFFILGGIGLLFAVPYFRFLRTVDEEARVETKKAASGLAAKIIFKVPTYLLMCLVFPVFVFGLWLIYGWLPTYFHDRFDLDLGASAFNATVFMQIATLFGILGGGWLADRLYAITSSSRFWILIGSFFLCAPSMYVLGVCESLVTARMSATAFGLFSGLFIGNVFPAAFEVVPADTRASAVGFLNFFGALVSGFAPLVGGMWKSTIGIEGLLQRTSFAYLMASIGMATGVLLLFKKDYERVH